MTETAQEGPIGVRHHDATVAVPEDESKQMKVCLATRLWITFSRLREKGLSEQVEYVSFIGI